MHLQRSILLGAILGAWTALVQSQETCTVDSNTGLIGADGGSAIFVAFEYDLYVATGTETSTITASLLPALEIAMAEALAARVIENCAGGETPSMQGIIGFDTKPVDEIVTDPSNTCDAADADVADCHVVHSEWTIYVSSSAEDVAAYIFLMLGGILVDDANDITDAITNSEFLGMNGKLEHATMTPIAITTIAPATVTPTASPMEDSSPPTNSSPPTKSPTSKGGLAGIFDFNAHMDTITDYREENTIIFYAIMVGAAVSLVCFCICFCKLCCGRGKGGGGDDSDDDDDDFDDE